MAYNGVTLWVSNIISNNYLIKNYAYINWPRLKTRYFTILKEVWH